MKGVTKILALTLVTVMLIPMLIACNESGGNNGGKNTSGRNDFVDDLPDDELDFQGKTFNVLCREDNAWGNFAHEITADEDEVELVNQAVYERNTAVEDRFGVTLNVMPIPGHWSQKDDFIGTFQNSILAGDGAYDFIMSQASYMAEMGLHELYLNICDVPYIDLSKDYYYQDTLNEIKINDKLYFVIGDYSLTYWEYLNVMYFNKQIAENNGIENLYDLVKNDKWTIDKCMQISKGIFKDLNGDGGEGEEDQFGYITDYENTADALPSQFDCQSTSHDDDGNIILNVDQSKMVSILEKLISFYNTEDVYTFKTSSALTMDENPLDTMFREDKALFYPERLNRAQMFRGMETDFGILPFPMWDENQGGYYTESQSAYSAGVIPIDVPDQEFCGAMVEALTAESSVTVIPAYYEQALVDKYSRDNESEEMLYLIRDGIRVNFARFYCDALGTSSWFRSLLYQKNSNFVSYYAANKSGYERNLKKILDIYKD